MKYLTSQVISNELKFYREIIKILLKIGKSKKSLTKDDLNSLKIKLSKKYNLKKIPTDAEIILYSNPTEIKKLSLITKPTRTLSGVAPIALMTKPNKCPHGTCIYCPGGLGSIYGDVPQSYTGKEPSTMRSIRNNYDPYLVVFNRLEQYIILNQNPEKTEVIIQGGTFLAMDPYYKYNFVKDIFKAMNDFSDNFYIKKKGTKNKELDYKKFKEFFELPSDKDDLERTKRIQKKTLDLKNINQEKKITFEKIENDLEKEQIKNENSIIKCVGLTIETKPDYGKLEHGNEMLKFGCTRVELGIQATDEKIIKFVNRGHTIKDSIESTRILKDLGFKINYHMMPGLPLSNKQKDIEMLIETIKNPDFRPDMFKIYPTLVMKGTALYNLWKLGKYKPITTEEAAEIISEFKKHIPHWIRIMRVQRDIPSNITDAGVDKTNLRQYVEKKLHEKNINCKCIRCREAGLLSLKGEKFKPDNYEIFVEKYEASKGVEFFISAETKDRKALFGYCRLRFPSQFLRKEITKESALIRELHVVGSLTGIGEEGEIQHKGLGKKLLQKAEQIAKENGKNKIVVISGIGVRNYYRKLGYEREEVYMVKLI
ncbi:MAG: tRNA uridine(34) 5-carboxymethylaminomethyl modification radical SAM/GNAT enzyme Elp3 [Candidatus Woesearchaeota archaeon]